MNILFYSSPILLILAAVLIRRWLTRRMLATRVKSLQNNLAVSIGHLYSANADYYTLCTILGIEPKPNPADDIDHDDRWVASRAAAVKSLQSRRDALQCALEAAKKEQRIN